MPLKRRNPDQRDRDGKSRDRGINVQLQERGTRDHAHESGIVYAAKALEGPTTALGFPTVAVAFASLQETGRHPVPRALAHKPWQ
jgi:hypothetical protein